VHSVGRAKKRPQGLLEYERAWLEKRVESESSVGGATWDRVSAQSGWLHPLLQPLGDDLATQTEAAKEQMRIRGLLPRWMHASEAALALAIALDEVTPAKSDVPDGRIVYTMRGKLDGFRSQKVRRAAYLLWTCLHREVHRRAQH